jgi:trans-2,3-dihydro-3-hydroxyanthranilate isomerase
MNRPPTHPYEILDVFTDTPLEGNPVAVFTEAEQVPSRLMQQTARELNLSETVFLLPGDAESDGELRIFTPGTELPFAGHPTLGAAFVLAARGEQPATVRLRTQAGVVPLTFRYDEDGPVFAEMEQPIPTHEPFAETDALLSALGISSRPELPVEIYRNGPAHVMVALATEAQTAGLAPDLRALAGLGEYGFSCFAPTATPGHFKTRMFGPAIGVAEDPATGSAAGPLALHLVRHQITQFGEPIVIQQGAEIGRPSRLHARVEGSAGSVAKVIVGGSAVLVARGQFRLQ